jgi:hypothetical protein
VAYERPDGAGRAVRLYENDQDAARVEISDALATARTGLADAPDHVQTFAAHVVAAGQRLIYASSYGIWSYDLVSHVLAPIYLAPDAQIARDPEIMCVVADENILAYRLTGDTQLWLSPLP